MGFDIREYTEAFEYFLLNMEKIEADVQHDIPGALEKLCKLLRVSKVSVTYYEDTVKDAQGKSDTIVLFEQGECDSTRYVKSSEITEKGNALEYYVYQSVNEDDWSELEKEKIQIMLKMLYVFNGRSHIAKLVNYLTYFDRDLGIYNLSYFFKTTNEYIAEEKIANYGACYFNLKRFSAINQMIGRENATVVMKGFLQKLEEKLFEDEFISRIGGDNFLILFRKENIHNIIDYLKGIEVVNPDDSEQKILISASAGIYMIPKDCRQAADIMDCVSTASSAAKNVLNESYVFYDEKLMEQVKEVKMIENIFPDAIKNEEFQVYYQPKVQLKDYRLKGAEALCRWYHNGEILPPYKFIPVFEQGQNICTLDFYMLEHVCRDLRRWMDEGKEIVKVSVNLSRRHLGDSELLEHILEIVDKYSIPHEYIEIELTETTTDVDFKDLKEIVSGLQKAGICTSVDDFGMGYSSLNLIRELPWDVLKLDKSFLSQNEKTQAQNHAMLKHIISMAQELGMECIVEGVETAEQVKLLKENNCFLAQGYYFDKPLPKGEFEKRLEDLSA